MRREIGTRRRIEADHDRLFNLSSTCWRWPASTAISRTSIPPRERTLGWSRHELMSAVPYLE
ncbi:MAG: hypothetical protein U1F87_04750 [Kiritimatiellia bacterium]